MTVGTKWTNDHSGNYITVLETFRMWSGVGEVYAVSAGFAQCYN